MKAIKICFKIVAVGIVLFIAYQVLVYTYVLFPWAVPWVGNIIIANPGKPEVTYGEFPIKITYEVNGEVKVIEDTVICEFDGFELREGSGKYRKWKSSLKSGNSSLAFLPVEQDGLTVEVGIFRGFPNYYMGDFEQSKEEYESSMADDRYRGYFLWEKDGQTGYPITEEEVWEKYKLKILDVQYSSPIENSFK